MKKQLDYGSLVISLDFEMMWGCHDWSSVEEYGRTNIKNVRLVIARITELFENYGIHATFATVGFIFCRNKNDALAWKPSKLPSYNNPIRSPFRDGYIQGIREEDEFLFFAPEVIQQLNNNPRMEIGSHTFSHYFCLESGQTREQFRADIEAAIEVANRDKIKCKSIVFPRNEVSKDYLEECAFYGFMAYRGNARKFFDHSSSRWKNIYNKISRFLDAYVNWGGLTTTTYSSIDTSEQPINIPASRMLRPYMRNFRWLESWRLQRIKKEMLHAAKHHELYHLWWHPHNFGYNIDENLAFLEEVLKSYRFCNEKYGMRSYTMSEFVEAIL